MGRSSNIEDRRGGGGGIGRMGMGLGGTAILLVLSLLFGRNLFEDTGAAPTVGESNGQLAPADSAREEPEVRFVSFVLDDAQQTWTKILPKYGARYHDAKLVLFRDATRDRLRRRADSDGALLLPQRREGLHRPRFLRRAEEQVRCVGRFRAGLRDRARARPSRAAHPRHRCAGASRRAERSCRRQSVLGGGWSSRRTATRASGRTRPSSATSSTRATSRKGLNAAASVGDDRILAQAGRRVNADNFTHGSSQQRVSWFRKGFESGDPRACDTFGSTGR